MRETDGKPRAMTAEEVAREIGVSKKWVVRHHAKLPFARKLSRKVIVYDRAGFERWWSISKPDP
jgi:hypothetical protein